MAMINAPTALLANLCGRRWIWAHYCVLNAVGFIDKYASAPIFLPRKQFNSHVIFVAWLSRVESTFVGIGSMGCWRSRCTDTYRQCTCKSRLYGFRRERRTHIGKSRSRCATKTHWTKGLFVFVVFFFWSFPILHSMFMKLWAPRMKQTLGKRCCSYYDAMTLKTILNQYW